ncbi:putative cytosol aminopeptidase [Thiomicrorhabdus immobilis]|uniref:Probable cytosol aminopeptidase n=1 Tax=Thiomicrorhabdus immobilis TaxID=2791037 RepID=A0ABM7MBI0_9GAMM|nr:leucyl aminopeptidase [Thiomicrorhabdus immobilis]BCN92717.1 putative cytosol aminopeptidase [Thiomicrorhabdus immobilis]
MKSIHFSFDTQLSNIDTLILPVTSAGKLPQGIENIQHLPEIENFVEELFHAGDFSGKVGKTLLLIKPKDFSIKRLLLVGIGELEKLTAKSYLASLKATADALDHCGSVNTVNALVFVAPNNIAENPQAWSAMQIAQVFQRSFYDYSHESRGEHPVKEPKLESMVFPCGDQTIAAKQGQATALGMALTQDLANMPSNFCTPTYLAETAIQLGEDYGYDVNILDREEMIEMGMGSFMAVAQGSITPPKMICLSYQGGKAGDAPIALVGKGVTFDTGGISLKPGEAMDEMKYDMGGAATVLGVFKALGELKPNINVVGVIPATENMPSGNAIKPGDVVTSLSGQTIEILNTDAEGRLILCDALTYTQQTYKPAKVIDMATLTGACIIALGHHVSAIMGNNQELVNELLAAGQATYDRFWQMPLGEEWDEQLKSNFADMANIGGRAGGSITAAQFLARYTKDVDWAHLDIAGTAWVSGANKGATGRPVPALVEYLLKQAN